MQEFHKIFTTDKAGFLPRALSIFRYQYRENAVYRAFTDALGIHPDSVSRLEQIPFLPVRFFKSHKIVSGQSEPEIYFESSGTTGMVNSRHWIQNAGLYKESFTRGFKLVYGEPRKYCILGLLPSYLERGHSSLVYMVEELVRQSGHPQSGFYLHDYAQLQQTLQALEHTGQPTLLIGVTYALLDFAEQFPQTLKHTFIMETGGMKGRRKEMIREEVHGQLMQAFGLNSIHSEYGMTELLSQAYSTGDGIFSYPPWMKIVLRDDEDPLTLLESGKGVINVIDLANVHSCSFIATDDAGVLYPDGRFEVRGRVDGSDLRGCSLLAL